MVTAFTPLTTARDVVDAPLTVSTPSSFSTTFGVLPANWAVNAFSRVSAPRPGVSANPSPPTDTPVISPAGLTPVVTSTGPPYPLTVVWPT